jgi:5-methylcytosine-specific restriction endonuclease McrA
MAVPEALARAIRLRAQERCQYCLMHERLQGATFHVEHVIPQSKGGESTLENLALACPGCNLHKADETRVPDPLTGEQVALFHPLQ